MQDETIIRAPSQATLGWWITFTDIVGLLGHMVSPHICSAQDPSGGSVQQVDIDDARVARECAEAMFATDAATRALGITIDEVGPGRATARMTLTGEMLNGYAMAHGGYLFLLADTAFAYACNTHDRRTVAAGCDIDFLAAGAAGDLLVARAVERVRTGRSGLYDVTVRRSADGAILAEMRGRSREVPGAVR
jgi:acyl-CoA thioesterase